MGLFRRTRRKAGRVAKNVAKNMILPPDDAATKKKASEEPAAQVPQHTDEEYEALKEKYDELMRARWEEYYRSSCDGECETCEYYDWCPDDFEDEDILDAAQAAEEDEDDEDEEAAAAEGDESWQDEEADELDETDEFDEADEPDEADAEDAAEEERELTEEELAAQEAAEAYYADGCDGECETCEHYDWCPAEEEEDPDNKVLFKGVTQGDVKNAAKEGVHLAREGAIAAKEIKEAMDDIFGGLDWKSLTK